MGPFTSDHAKFAQDQRGKALKSAPGAADLRLTNPTLIARSVITWQNSQSNTLPASSEASF